MRREEYEKIAEGGSQGGQGHHEQDHRHAGRGRDAYQCLVAAMATGSVLPFAPRNMPKRVGIDDEEEQDAQQDDRHYDDQVRVEQATQSSRCRRRCPTPARCAAWRAPRVTGPVAAGSEGM